MKKSFLFVIAVTLMAVPAFAFESGDAANFQVQAQDLAGTDYGLAGAESKYVGGQLDVGASSTNGGFGMEYNHQVQGAHVNAINSTGTVRHQYDIDMETRGASVAGGWGTGGHVEGNVARAAISTRSDGVGTGMVSGASIEAAGGSAAGATWNADAVGMTNTTAHTEYESINYGASSAQYSAGVSNVQTSTVAYANIGGQRAGARAATVGSVGMVNDGSGGAMATVSKSHSEVDTATAGIGAGYAGASASANNTHQGQQVAVGPGTYQYQETMVATSAAE